MDLKDGFLLVDRGFKDGVRIGDSVQFRRRQANLPSEMNIPGLGTVVELLDGHVVSKIVLGEAALESLQPGDTARITPPSTPYQPLEATVKQLKANPLDRHARSRLFLQVLMSDAQVMGSMRYFHGTGKAAMRHYYPTHHFIHPFLRACLFAQQGREDDARNEFASAVAAATEYLSWVKDTTAPAASSDLAEVVREESRLRLKHLWEGR